MASFAEALHAVDDVLGTTGLATYIDLLESLKADVLDGDLVAQELISLARAEGEWIGTAADLLVVIGHERPPRGWPTTAADLSKRINGVMSVLRESHIEFTRSRTGSKRPISLRDLDFAVRESDAAGFGNSADCGDWDDDS